MGLNRTRRREDAKTRRKQESRAAGGDHRALSPRKFSGLRHNRPFPSRLRASLHAVEPKRNEAFVRAWSGQKEPAGTLWWEWTPGAGGAEDGSYTPKGKPAEAVLRAWFRARLVSESGVEVDRGARP